MTNTNSSKYWNKIAQRHPNVHYYNELTGNYKANVILEYLSEQIPDLSEKTLLKTDLYEEAKGSDQLLFRNEFKISNNFGFDISPYLVHSCSKKNNNFSNMFFCSDVLNLSIKDNSFDIILSVSTLDHFTSEKVFLKSINELLRVLKPGGNFILILDNKFSLFALSNYVKIAIGMLPFSLGKTFTLRQLKKMSFDFDVELTNVEYKLHAPINYFPRFFNFLSLKNPELFIGRINTLNSFLKRLLGKFAASFLFVTIEKPTQSQADLGSSMQ